jgi:beta-phosphoglucomutase-like phosphatase (HAD superfamily)
MVTKLGGGMSRSVRVALFDVDGTLVDTNYLHAVTWWEAFTQAGYQPAMADIHRAIGMGSDQMLDKLLPADRDRDADADVRAAHSTLYATYWSRLRPLPGAADLLRACKQRGLAVVLASSTDEPEFNALRGALDAEDAIDAATLGSARQPARLTRCWAARPERKLTIRSADRN